MPIAWSRAAVLGGAALLVAGSFMTWISVDLGFAAFSSAGTDNIEGKLTAAAGVALLAVGATLKMSGIVGRLSVWLGLAAGLFGGIVLLLEYLDVRKLIAETDPSQATATVGIGVWVTGLGALAAIVAVAHLVAVRLRGAA